MKIARAGVNLRSLRITSLVLRYRDRIALQDDVRPGEPSTIPQLYNNSSVLVANPYFSDVLHVYEEGLAVRPSGTTGNIYPDVSRAYFEAVRAVLTHHKTAEVAASELQQKLVKVTGLKDATSASKGRPVEDAAVSRQ